MCVLEVMGATKEKSETQMDAKLSRTIINLESELSDCEYMSEKYLETHNRLVCLVERHGLKSHEMDWFNVWAWGINA